MRISQILGAAPKSMLISAILAFIFLNGLGVWQLERLKWKEGLIADMARTESMPAVPASQALGQGRPSWRSVTLPACPLAPDRFIYMHSELAGEPGYRVLTACPLDTGRAMLVDLGFATDKLSVQQGGALTPVGRLRPYEKPGMVTPVNRPADKDWYFRSAADMGPSLGTALRDDYFVVLDLERSNAHMEGLVQGPLTAPLPNRHFEYALTWFGLAWAMLGVFGSFIYQRVRKPA